MSEAIDSTVGSAMLLTLGVLLLAAWIAHKTGRLR